MKNNKLSFLLFIIAPIILFTVYNSLSAPFFRIDPDWMRSLVLTEFCLIAILFLIQRLKKDSAYFTPAIFGVFLLNAVIIFSIPIADYGRILGENRLLFLFLERPQFSLYAGLFLMAAFPPLPGLEPFTYYFAKQNYSQDFWDTKLFRHVNLYLNYFWAVVFAACFFVQFVPNMVLQIVIPIVIQIAAGFTGNKKLIPFLMDRLAYVERNAPKDYLKTAYQAITGMPFLVDKKSAEGVSVVFQFNITGSEEFSAYIQIDKGRCIFADGIHQTPDMIINSSAEVWLSVSRGEMKGSEAFLKKKYFIHGDLSYMELFQKLFESRKKNVSADKKTRKISDTGSMELFSLEYHTLPKHSIKKVLSIQSSPRSTEHSKTEFMNRSFLNGCAEAGAEVETIYLNKMKINECLGCFNCWTKTPGTCIHKDDVKNIVAKMFQADLIVFAFPLYHFGINALLKKFIERMLPVAFPYMIASENGNTTHPIRDEFYKTQSWVIIGVCGFPEVSHFNAASYHLHTLARSSGDGHFKIIGELYRPASEILNTPTYGSENARVFEAVTEAGRKAVREGSIDKKLMKEIADVRFEKEKYYNEANMMWDLCIQDKKTLAQMQHELFDDEINKSA